jgi:ATP-dependent Zn protease
MVTQLPEDDTNSLTRQQMMARLVVAMGGRAAEEKIFGKNAVTSGERFLLPQPRYLSCHGFLT